MKMVKNIVEHGDGKNSTKMYPVFMQSNTYRVTTGEQLIYSAVQQLVLLPAVDQDLAALAA